MPSRVCTGNSSTSRVRSAVVGFCGNDGQPAVTLDSVGTLGAASMLLIDACTAPGLADGLKDRARPGSLIVGLDHPPGTDQETKGRDSVTVIGAVIRELCYPARPDLSPGTAARAVRIVNTQITARNDAEGLPAARQSGPNCACTDASKSGIRDAPRKLRRYPHGHRRRHVIYK
jgi:hypothetical protein